MDQLNLAVGLENNARHLTAGVGVPVDGQAIFVIALKGTQVLSMVEQDWLQLRVSGQVIPQQEGETVLKHLETWGKLLLLRDVLAVRQFLPLQAPFIHVEDLLGLVPPSSMMALSSSGYEATASASALLAS